MNNLFQRKGYGLIMVNNESDIDKVKNIIKSIDEDEFECYYPTGLVSTGRYPVYIGKFELDSNVFYKECFNAGVLVRVVSGVDEYIVYSFI